MHLTDLCCFSCSPAAAFCFSRASGIEISCQTPEARQAANLNCHPGSSRACPCPTVLQPVTQRNLPHTDLSGPLGHKKAQPYYPLVRTQKNLKLNEFRVPGDVLLRRPLSRDKNAIIHLGFQFTSKDSVNTFISKRITTKAHQRNWLL